jgi:hypothetical protein
MTKTVYSVLNQTYGFGDFIRGSIQLAYLAKKNGLNFRMHLSNHPLHPFFAHVEMNRPININHRYYGVHPKESLPHLLEKFAASDGKELFVATNFFYDKESIDQELKDELKRLLEFHEKYQRVETPVEKYQVLHVRTSDNHQIRFERLVERVKSLNLGPNTIVISSDYDTKRKLHEMFGFHYLETQPVHTAFTNDLAALANTVMDYTILSKSERTYCFSYYDHGSGFSEHCSFLNNIPYAVEVI